MNENDGIRSDGGFLAPFWLDPTSGYPYMGPIDLPPLTRRRRFRYWRREQAHRIRSAIAKRIAPWLHDGDYYW